jgi:hypothetical protein
MLATAVRRGVGQPIYMDATHGLQRYGLKVVTVHIKDEEGSGVLSIYLRKDTLTGFRHAYDASSIVTFARKLLRPLPNFLNKPCHYTA